MQCRQMTLMDLLKSAQRETRWGPQPDPIAVDILGNVTGPADVATLAGLLNDRGIVPRGILDAGASSLVLDAGDKVVRLGTGEIGARIPVSELLQADHFGSVGTLRYEILRRVNTADINEADVEAMTKTLKAKGYEFCDPAEDNLGRLPNGDLVVIDPGAVKLSASMALMSDEQSFALRMAQHLSAGLNLEDAARAVLDDDQRLVAAALATDHNCSIQVDDTALPCTSRRGQVGAAIRSELARRVYAKLRGTDHNHDSIDHAQ